MIATDSLFITVTVTKTDEEQAPGDYDPIIPLFLGFTLNAEAGTTPPGSLRQHYIEGAARYNSISLQMNTDGDGKLTWYEYKAASDDMTYECDPTLGTPQWTDCSQLEYSKLGASSDTLSVGPGTPKVLTSSE